MIAVIAARGGSKGLPRKNVLPLAGKPLIVHSLECALATQQVKRVIVSTDDDEISDIARSITGVEVPFKRPAHLATDTASGPDVYLHVADWLAEHEGTQPAALVSLLATAPLRQPSDVDACISLFKDRSAEVVMSVAIAKPAAWHQTMMDDGALRPVPGINSDIDNRQAFGRVVIPNGSVYVFDVAALRRTRNYFGARSFGFLMPPQRSVDIDHPDDFLIAEALLRHGAAA